jgi:hypothetical protein
MTNQEIVNLIGNGGLVAALVFGMRWLANQFTDAQKMAAGRSAELVETLRGVVVANTDALHEVKNTLQACHEQARNKSHTA